MGSHARTRRWVAVDASAHISCIYINIYHIYLYIHTYMYIYMMWILNAGTRRNAIHCVLLRFDGKGEPLLLLAWHGHGTRTQQGERIDVGKQQQRQPTTTTTIK